ncbi:16S rRNA (guanine(966)-N(2))-methyltransferase RsmD [Furfurilactobacillus siliginis]|uniref:Methyltransferase n=1 Tax=Furfurilactobacillus siliginis TaxID=348151 RepID=A0A0R2L080_9LACO|nr:16S rRNA (guanine(966)-N(2))-methyltransferase RsmD [Furfurilactobacillus siliginis]KRN94864.1 methyltransferase [Furfurilactobacillus siliginis]GEK28435.1 rRNA methyltransferase [Furfurilactobacillus siliginis]
MRIVAGDFGGRPLGAVPGTLTRPTTDKVKEAMFSMIGPYFNGGQALDLFAGSGGLAIEAVSRGIEHAVLVDHQYAAIKTIKANIAVTKAPEQFQVIKGEADGVLKRLAAEHMQFTLILLDPPYAKQKIMANLQFMADNDMLLNGATIIAETDQDAQLPEQFGNFTQTHHKDYGITDVMVYQYNNQ